MDRLWLFSETGEIYVVPSDESIVDETGHPQGELAEFLLDISNKNEFASCFNRVKQIVLVSSSHLFEAEYLGAIPASASRLALVKADTSPEARVQLDNLQLDGLLFSPFTADAVHTKLKKAYDAKKALVELQDEIKNYSSIAFTAMSSASEMGVVAFYAQAIQNTLTFDRLAEQTLRALHDLSVQGFVQFAFDDLISVYPKEISNGYRDIFTSLRSSSHRIISQGRFLIFNFDNVQLLITDAPLGAPDKYGRLRDVIAHIVSIAESRARTIKLNFLLKSQQENTRMVMMLMQMASRDNRNSVKEIMTNLSLALRELATGMDLNMEQESALLNLSEDALNSLEALHEATDAVEEHFASLLVQLDQAEKLLQGEEEVEAPHTDVSVELF